MLTLPSVSDKDLITTTTTATRGKATNDGLVHGLAAFVVYVRRLFKLDCG